MTAKEKTIAILAQGDFPASGRCLQLLRDADLLLCCDGAAATALEHGFEPDEIVGDLDSLDAALRERFAARLFHDRDQECNDQTKAFRRALSYHPTRIVILGATGRREDHTLGNISLLADYAAMLAKTDSRGSVDGVSDGASAGKPAGEPSGNPAGVSAGDSAGVVFPRCRVEMWSDYGHFEVILNSATLPARPGQEISLFSFDPSLRVHADGLQYPTDAVVFDSLWKATLNVAAAPAFTLTLSHPAPLLIYWAD